jgi:energy-coupling factor transporter ATP-binding protein EcfA2
MKIKKLYLENFKKFGARGKTINFCDSMDFPNDQICIIGDNASGKSSVLQAISLLVGSATRRGMSPADLIWPGYDYDYIQNGRFPPRMEATIAFSEDEVNATRDFAQRLLHEIPSLTLPSTNLEVRIFLNYFENKVRAISDAAYFQFKGHQHARQIRAENEHMTDRLRRVGGIYWYPEQRTSTSIHGTLDANATHEMPSTSDAQLRSILSNWTGFHDMLFRRSTQLRPGQKDRFADLNELFTKVFPGRFLIGSTPNPDPEKILSPAEFWLENEEHLQYELSNMSAGERAIFPILIDFANWEINNSIIIIDEIELHLHPPAQQSFVSALQSLGKNNQFIITTHSEHVLRSFHEDQIIRLS